MIGGIVSWNTKWKLLMANWIANAKASRITDSNNVDRGTYPTHAHAFRAIDAHLDDGKPFVNDAP